MVAHAARKTSKVRICPHEKHDACRPPRPCTSSFYAVAAQTLRTVGRVRQCVRERPCAGTSSEVTLDMSETTENLGWTIPLHVIMWTTIGVGLIMAMAVLLMH